MNVIVFHPPIIHSLLFAVCSKWRSEKIGWCEHLIEGTKLHLHPENELTSLACTDQVGSPAETALRDFN